MARYFRSDPAGARANSYTVVADEVRERPDSKDPLVTHTEYPMGSVRILASDESFIPHWNNDVKKDSSSSPNGSSSLDQMVSDTGLSKQFLEHLHNVASAGIHSSDMSTRDSHAQLLRSLNTEKSYETPETWQKSMETIKRHPLANPDTLFTHVPGSVTINTAFFDPDMRYHFPTTLGIIKQDYPSHQIIPSHDLSAHSLKVVKHAARKGLLKEGEDARQTNHSVYSPRGANPEYVKELEIGDTELTPQEVASARKGLKEMLLTARNARTSPEQPKPHMSPQFDHPTLFDE